MSINTMKNNVENNKLKNNPETAKETFQNIVNEFDEIIKEIKNKNPNNLKQAQTEINNFLNEIREELSFHDIKPLFSILNKAIEISNQTPNKPKTPEERKKATKLAFLNQALKNKLYS